MVVRIKSSRFSSRLPFTAAVDREELRLRRRTRCSAGFGGRDLVVRDLVACSRFWGRDRLSTSVVRGASPFWKSSFVRAKKRQTRDRASVGHATLATPCLFLPFFLKNTTHIYLPSPFLRQSQCTHLRIPRPPLLGGAVPRCPRSLVQTSTPVPFQCRFLRRAPVTPPRAAGAWSRIFRS